MQLFTLFVSLLLLFSGCSTRGAKTYRGSLKKPTPTQTKQPSYRLTSKNPITTALYKEYIKWDGVPYKYGGNSFEGVDCSALVQSIYRDAFRIHLPRTTKGQAKVGYRVKRRELQAGDIVLFKTGYATRHSGIYLEKGNFINASNSYGVTISNINNPYWRAKYWQARRVLPLEEF